MANKEIDDLSQKDVPDQADLVAVQVPGGSNFKSPISGISQSIASSVVDSFPYYARELDSGSTTTPASYTWNLATNGGIARISGMFNRTVTDAHPDFTNEHSANMYAMAFQGGSPNPLVAIQVYRITYTTGSPGTVTIEHSVLAQVAAGTTGAHSRVFSTVSADNAFHDVVFAQDNSATQQARVQLKTDGDVYQFRVSANASSVSDAGFSFQADIIR